MASDVYIRCGCGAEIKSAILDLINNFDRIHGSEEHQNIILQLKRETIEQRKTKWEKVKNGF